MKYIQNATHKDPVLCIDFGSQTPLPKTVDGEAYYLLQVILQHLGVHRFPSEHVTIHSYDESCGGQGTNEVCTAIYEAAVDLVSKGAQSITIVSDGTMAQNKSQFNMCVCVAKFSAVIRYFMLFHTKLLQTE